MLRNVARMCSMSSATTSNAAVRSLSSTASQSFSSDIHNKVPEYQAKQQEGGVKWDWVNDPVANPRMLPMEAFGSGMDLDRIESCTVEVSEVSYSVPPNEHGQSQNELLSDDPDM